MQMVDKWHQARTGLSGEYLTAGLETRPSAETNRCAFAQLALVRDADCRL